VAAGDRPRHDRPVTHLEALDAWADLDDLRDRLVADRERAVKRDPPADVADRGIDQPGLESCLHRARASAALLLREHGVGATSLARVLEHSSSPRGSIGHHFPGGSARWFADAVRWAGGVASAAMRHALERGDTPAELFAMVCGCYRRALVDSDFAAGCAVGAVAHDAFRDAPLRDTADEVFNDWRAILEPSLTAAGHDPTQARGLAELCIAGLEGALMLARVDRTTTPLDRVEEQPTTLLAARPVSHASAKRS
jgi:AcrR family transcriptional regulator